MVLSLVHGMAVVYGSSLVSMVSKKAAKNPIVKVLNFMTGLNE